MGHGSARIARALGVREMTIRAIVRGDAPTVSTALRDAVADLYDAWWDKRAPERTRAERAAATAARRRAIAGNWCAGAGLDDDELDTPGYKPKSNWKPAAGTGTAPDIQPSTAPAEPRHPCSRPCSRRPLPTPPQPSRARQKAGAHGTDHPRRHHHQQPHPPHRTPRTRRAARNGKCPGSPAAT